MSSSEIERPLLYLIEIQSPNEYSNRVSSCALLCCWLCCWRDPKMRSAKSSKQGARGNAAYRQQQNGKYLPRKFNQRQWGCRNSKFKSFVVQKHHAVMQCHRVARLHSFALLFANRHNLRLLSASLNRLLNTPRMGVSAVS